MDKVSDSHHLLRRNGIWYYRRRVPDDLRESIGKRFIQFSLRTANKAQAKKLREAWDLRWSAEFEGAQRRCETDIVNSPNDKHELTEPLAIRLVRNYVERLDHRFSDSGNTPETEAQRREMAADIESSLQILKNVDDPRGAERVFTTGQKLLQESGARLENDGVLASMFDELVRRGLLEIDYRKLARLAEDYSRRAFDPLFDPAAPPTITFAELSEQFLEIEALEAAGNGTSQKSMDRQRANVALLVQLVGGEILVRDLDYDACVRVRTLLSRTPANLNKLFGAINIDEAIARATAEARKPLAPITQAQYLATLRKMLDLAAKKRLISFNPANGMKPLMRDLPHSERRLPFEPSQLEAFFHSEFYLACAAAGPTPYRYDQQGWRFWLPLLSLFTGLRPRELLQIHVDDLRQSAAGIPYLDVIATEQDDENPASKTLKTASSRRKVPLHPLLLRIGFISFVEEQKKLSDDPRLFPSLKPNKYGDPAWYPLKRFNDTFLPQEMPNKGRRQVFYSFRHSFRDALRAIGAGPDVLQALGWSQGNRVVSDYYGAGLDPDQLHEFVRRLSFKGVELSHLYDKKESDP